MLFYFRRKKEDQGGLDGLKKLASLALKAIQRYDEFGCHALNLNRITSRLAGRNEAGRSN
jgi:hypothetical protein